MASARVDRWKGGEGRERGEKGEESDDADDADDVDNAKDGATCLRLLSDYSPACGVTGTMYQGVVTAVIIRIGLTLGHAVVLATCRSSLPRVIIRYEYRTVRPSITVCHLMFLTTSPLPNPYTG